MILAKTSKANAESGVQNPELKNKGAGTNAENTEDAKNMKEKTSSKPSGAKQKNEEIITDGSDEANSEFGIRNSELEKELEAEKDKYLRLAAEYDNFRKRSAKERDKIYSDARVETIDKLLPVYDNLERALKMECADDAYYKGVELIMTQLTEILESMGVREIQAVGEPFDPNSHNAVMTIENPELGEKIIAEELQKGFMLGERVIRFSTVVVAN